MRGGYVFTRDGWEMDGWLWAGNSDDIPDESTLITTTVSRGERAEQRVLMAGNGTAANGTAANLTAPPQLVVNATAVLAAARAASTSQLAANASAAAQKSARDESDSRWWDPNIWMIQMQSLHSYSRYMYK